MGPVRCKADESSISASLSVVTTMGRSHSLVVTIGVVELRVAAETGPWKSQHVGPPPRGRL